ncbi:hypothetical protein Fmac_019945 [Flemingia macrophylla]|uniref:Uncharacterized protein n=1 Tax=Flemingia macrophylla TaxID=520843 RepID=A0ABD1M983_9FABA
MKLKCLPLQSCLWQTYCDGQVFGELFGLVIAKLTSFSLPCWALKLIFPCKNEAELWVERER